MSAVPVWLLEEDASEADELNDYIGRAIDHAITGSATAADVIASDLLRRQGEAMAEGARLAEAKAQEIALATARIAMRYDVQIARAQTRAGYYEQGVVAIAESIDWSAEKKKSRLVGHGTYGMKREPERVKITDQDKAIAFARTALPSAIKEKVTITVDHRAIAPAVLARVHADGDVPDGFEHIAEHQVFYARPEIG